MTSTSRLATTVLLVVAFTSAGAAVAQVPQSLNYQGYLTDSSGQALTAPVIVEFSIYAVESGGTPLWSEFQTIEPTAGLFSTSFGSATNPFPVGLFDTPLFLGVKVDVDAEMTPRTPFSASAFAIKADDALTVGGLSSSALDQSGDVDALNSSLGATQTTVAGVQSSVSQLSSDVASVESDVAGLSSDVQAQASDITAIEGDVSSAQSDITTIALDVQGKQDRVTGTCSSGSSIRSIFSSGSVTCETDDTGPWSFDGDAYLGSGTRVGLGTSAPAAALQIDSAPDTDPFRARVASSTKLRVHVNGSVSLGTSIAGPENGAYISGQTGIGISAPGAKLGVSDPNWQMRLINQDTGGGSWYVGSSANAWAAGGGKLVINSIATSSGAAMVIDSGKNVGIGTTSPSTKLHIGSGSDVTPAGGGYLLLGSNTGTNIGIDNNEIMARSSGAAATLSLNAEGGEVRINSGGSRDHDSLEIRGRVLFDNGGNSGMRITATNSNPTNALLEPTLFEEALVGSSTAPFWRMYSREFYALSPLEYKSYSDRSLKTNVAPIDSAMDKVAALEGVSYSLSRSPMGERKRPLTEQERFVNDNQLGFIAQDVAAVLPQLVSEDESSGLQTVAYMGLIPVLVEALKEQQAQLDAQRAEIDALKARLK